MVLDGLSAIETMAPLPQPDFHLGLQQCVNAKLVLYRGR